jgi:hypothetical protein
MQRIDAGGDDVLLGLNLPLVVTTHQILDAGLGNRDGRFGHLQDVSTSAIGLLADLAMDATRGNGVLGI